MKVRLLSDFHQDKKTFNRKYSIVHITTLHLGFAYQNLNFGLVLCRYFLIL